MLLLFILNVVIVVGVPIAFILLALWGIRRIDARSDIREQESQRLATEVEEVRRRLGELEAKLARTGESAASTQRGLREPRDAH